MAKRVRKLKDSDSSFLDLGTLSQRFPTIKKISELFPDAKICLLTINKNKHLYDAVDFDGQNCLYQCL